MIDVKNLTKRFGTNTAIDDISFHVAPGEIVGFLGPNGAGKTTTMRILSTYLPATGGTVRIAGFDVFKQSIAVRQKIGYLPEHVPLYDDMRVIEYLTYRGRLKGLSGRRLRTRLDYSLDACGIKSVRREVIRRLSKGFQQRVGLADCLIHDPTLLILDEPTIGLDPNQIRQIRSLVRGLGQNHTILLSSHILHEVEMVCDRVLIMHRGKIVASDTTRNLVDLMQGNPRVMLEIQGPWDAIEQRLQSVNGIVRVIQETPGHWQRIVCECERGRDLCPEIFSIASREGWALRQLKTQDANLEDVFVELTNKAG